MPANGNTATTRYPDQLRKSNRKASIVTKKDPTPVIISRSTRDVSNIKVDEQKTATASRNTRGISNVTDGESRPDTRSRSTRESSTITEKKLNIATRSRSTRVLSSIKDDEPKTATASRTTRGISSVIKGESIPATRSRESSNITEKKLNIATRSRNNGDASSIKVDEPKIATKSSCSMGISSVTEGESMPAARSRSARESFNITEKKHNIATRSRNNGDASSIKGNAPKTATKSSCSRGTSSVTMGGQRPATRSRSARESFNITEEKHSIATRSRNNRDASSIKGDAPKTATKSSCSRGTSSVTMGGQRPATRSRNARESSDITEEKHNTTTKSRGTWDASNIKEEERKPATRSRSAKKSSHVAEDEKQHFARSKRARRFAASRSPSPKKARKASKSPVRATRNKSRGRLRTRKSTNDERIQDSEEQSGEDHRPKMMKAILKAWRKEKIYKTKGVTDTQEKILSHDCVCVVGLPGAGKSTAIRHAALSLEREGFFIYLIHKSEEFEKYFDEDKKQVFILDDVLGIYSLSQNEIDFWMKHNDDIRSVLGANTKLLVSIRTPLYNQAIKGNKFVFLDKSSCIDFCDISYRLDIIDMILMLTHFLTVEGIDKVDKLVYDIWYYTEEQVQKLIEEEEEYEISSNVGLEFSDCFPLLCKVFCSDAFARKNPQEFFLNPFRAITQIFQNIKSDNKLQFCSLVLCAVFDGELKEDMFSINCELNDELEKESVALRNVIMTSCGLGGQEYLPQIKSALNSLDGVYVTHVANTYFMAHRVFYDVVIYLFNDGDPSFVLKYGSSELILDRIKIVETVPEDDPYVITINDDTNIKKLADRLFLQLEYDTWRGAEFIAKNPNIDNNRLISCLKGLLSDREKTDRFMIYALFLQCMFTVQFSYIHKNCEVTQYKLIEFCVQTGIDCNVHTVLGYPLRSAVWTSSFQLVQLLLQHGADKRRVEDEDTSVLHSVCMGKKYNKLQIIKLLTQNGEDQSVVRFITNDREKILQKIDRDNLQLEEVFPDYSTKVLTTDKHRIKHYVEHYAGRLQLVERLHDNILTYVDDYDRNILHYLADDIESTSYVLGLLSDTNLPVAINQRDNQGRTPYWYVVNKEHPYNARDFFNNKDTQDMIQLYKDNQAILYDSYEEKNEEDFTYEEN